MTRPFNAQFYCPNCQTFQTQESAFGRWIRNQPDLDSRDGFCVVDQDYWIHRFKTSEQGRKFQLLMLVEIKTLGKELTPAQKDTLLAVNAVTRNRRETPTKKRRYESGYNTTTTHHSFIIRRPIYLRLYGMHVLTFSNLGPDDSDWIRWDNRSIDQSILVQLLRFDLDPDTLRPIDLRLHHKKENDLFNYKEG